MTGDRHEASMGKWKERAKKARQELEELKAALREKEQRIAQLSSHLESEMLNDSQPLPARVGGGVHR